MANTCVSYRLPDDLIRELADLSKASGLTINALVIMILRAGLASEQVNLLTKGA